MTSLIKVCGLMLAGTVVSNPAGSTVPLSSQAAQPPSQELPVTERTGNAVNVSDAQCAVSARRASNGSVVLEVQTLGGPSRGFFHYDQSFVIPPAHYPLDVRFTSGLALEGQVAVSAYYDGTNFEGRVTSDENAAAVVSYEIVVDRFLRVVRRVLISEIVRRNDGVTRETSRLVCEPAPS